MLGVKASLFPICSKSIALVPILPLKVNGHRSSKEVALFYKDYKWVYVFAKPENSFRDALRLF